MSIDPIRGVIGLAAAGRRHLTVLVDDETTRENYLAATELGQLVMVFSRIDLPEGKVTLESPRTWSLTDDQFETLQTAIVSASNHDIENRHISAALRLIVDLRTRRR